MKYITLFILICGPFFIVPQICSTLFAQEERHIENTSKVQDQVEIATDFSFINLTLAESIAIALKHNFDIKISKMNPDLGELGISAEKSRFDPVLKIR